MTSANQIYERTGTTVLESNSRYKLWKLSDDWSPWKYQIEIVDKIDPTKCTGWSNFESYEKAKAVFDEWSAE